MTEKAKQEGNGIGAGMLAILMAWPVIVAIGAGYIIDKRTAASIEEALAGRPQIAVVDDVALIGLALDAGADRYDPRSVASTVNRIVERNGYSDSVLLSKSMVLYAPQSTELSVAAGGARAVPEDGGQVRE